MAVKAETLQGMQFAVPETVVSPPSLRIIGNSVDLDIDLSKLDKQTRHGKEYEDACFAQIIQELEPSEVAYGAHFLNTAFNSHLKARGVSIPDALVGEIDYSMHVLGQSEAPLDRPVIRVKRIIEARTGEINGVYKLKRFKNLTAEMRRNPDFFTIAIRDLLAGRGGILNLAILFAPHDSEIDVDFYSPHQHTEREIVEAKRQLGEHPFGDVGHKTVPHPALTAAA